MKAIETKLFAFLHKSSQFIIPIYQRKYSWTKKQCDQLWVDVVNTGRNEAIDGHFVGSVVYVERGLYSHSAVPQLLVIDGQQRLTTVSLMIAALCRELEKRSVIEGINSRKLANYYLLNSEEEGELKYKLLLTRSDRDILRAIVSGKEVDEDSDERTIQNFNYFHEKIKSGNDELLGFIYKGLSKLIIVDIALDRDHDNPQLIFESLNSTGLDLSQADLIRNYILMGLEPTEQQELYEEHWYKLEQAFGKSESTWLFDRFMRDYLTLKTGNIPRVDEVYESFKRFARASNDNVSEIVTEVHKYGVCYTAFAREHESDKELAKAFHDINILKMDVAYPLLLELYNDYQQSVLSKAELLECVRYMENYVFRRAICEIPTNSLNKTFANLGRELKKDRYVESLRAALLLKSAYRRFPDDAEFERGLLTRDLYNFRSRNYWLRRLENYQRKERVNVEEYTIEHIMPQNENLSEQWKSDLGENWENIHNTYLHTLGNLTLTAYNSELSDRSFKEKRNMEGGFADSPLRLNRGLDKIDKWNEEEIVERAKQLAKRAKEVWSAPQLSEDVLKAYRPQQEAEVTEYTLDDHPHLKEGKIRELFEHFRNQVKSLDDDVREVVLKLYIAYKLDTNFVDVVPQASRLRLSLNMRFTEVNDPKGLCKDVSNLGRWGNGDVEVGLSTIDDLPDVMDLVRQSYEKQLEGTD